MIKFKAVPVYQTCLQNISYTVNKYLQIRIVFTPLFKGKMRGGTKLQKKHFFLSALVFCHPALLSMPFSKSVPAAGPRICAGAANSFYFLIRLRRDPQFQAPLQLLIYNLTFGFFI